MMDMITPDADDHVQVGAIFDLANIHRFKISQQFHIWKASSLMMPTMSDQTMVDMTTEAQVLMEMSVPGRSNLGGSVVDNEPLFWDC